MTARASQLPDCSRLARIRRRSRHHPSASRAATGRTRRSRLFPAAYAIRAVPPSIAVVVTVWTPSPSATAAVLAVAAVAQTGDSVIGLAYEQWGMVAGATVGVVRRLAGLITVT